MPYHLPDFHLVCDVYNSTSIGVLGTRRIAALPCQLTTSRFSFNWVLKVAKLTDLRPYAPDATPAYSGDIVNAPAGSNNYFWLQVVLDVARGYPNEYRAGLMSRLTNLQIFPIT